MSCQKISVVIIIMCWIANLNACVTSGLKLMHAATFYLSVLKLDTRTTFSNYRAWLTIQILELTTSYWFPNSQLSCTCFPKHPPILPNPWKISEQYPIIEIWRLSHAHAKNTTENHVINSCKNVNTCWSVMVTGPRNGSLSVWLSGWFWQMGCCWVIGNEDGNGANIAA